MNRHQLLAELNAIATNDSHPLAKDSDVAKACHGAGHAIDHRITGTGDLPDRDKIKGDSEREKIKRIPGQDDPPPSDED